MLSGRHYTCLHYPAILPLTDAHSTASPSRAFLVACLVEVCKLSLHPPSTPPPPSSKPREQRNITNKKKRNHFRRLLKSNKTNYGPVEKAKVITSEKILSADSARERRERRKKNQQKKKGTGGTKMF